MPNVSVADLKSSLDTYLDRVKAGEEIVVLEDGHAIARVVPLTSDNLAWSDANLERMVRSGIVRPRRRKPDTGGLRPPRVADPDGYGLRMLLEEREEGR